MRTRVKEVQGIDWRDAAVMNCAWRGPRLRDVLLAAGVEDLDPLRDSDKEDSHVGFECHAVNVQDDSWYGASVPLRYAMSKAADIILALEVYHPNHVQRYRKRQTDTPLMNSTPLTPEHGYPIRVIIPGIAGARSVKWLDSITIQEQESQNYYMQHDYKVLPPEAVDSDTAEQYWDRVPPLMEMPVNSVIARPADGDLVEVNEEGILEITGYALPQGGHGPVTRVEVSIDGGKQWKDAELLPSTESDEAHGKWAWMLWHISVSASQLQTLAPSFDEKTASCSKQQEKLLTLNILSRATDAGGHTQAAGDEQWNLRGVAYNGYGEARGVEVVLVSP